MSKFVTYFSPVVLFVRDLLTSLPVTQTIQRNSEVTLSSELK